MNYNNYYNNNNNNNISDNHFFNRDKLSDDSISYHTDLSTPISSIPRIIPMFSSGASSISTASNTSSLPSVGSIMTSSPAPPISSLSPSAPTNAPLAPIGSIVPPPAPLASPPMNPNTRITSTRSKRNKPAPSPKKRKSKKAAAINAIETAFDCPKSLSDPQWLWRQDLQNNRATHAQLSHLSNLLQSSASAQTVSPPHGSNDANANSSGSKSRGSRKKNSARSDATTNHPNKPAIACKSRARGGANNSNALSEDSMEIHINCQQLLKFGCPKHDLAPALRAHGYEVPSALLCNGYSVDCPASQASEQSQASRMQAVKRWNLQELEMTFRRFLSAEKPLCVEVTKDDKTSQNGAESRRVEIELLRTGEGVFPKKFRPGMYKFDGSIKAKNQGNNNKNASSDEEPKGRRGRKDKKDKNDNKLGTWFEGKLFYVRQSDRIVLDTFRDLGIEFVFELHSDLEHKKAKDGLTDIIGGIGLCQLLGSQQHGVRNCLLLRSEETELFQVLGKAQVTVMVDPLKLQQLKDENVEVNVNGQILNFAEDEIVFAPAGVKQQLAGITMHPMNAPEQQMEQMSHSHSYSHAHPHAQDLQHLQHLQHLQPQAASHQFRQQHEPQARTESDHKAWLQKLQFESRQQPTQSQPHQLQQQLQQLQQSQQSQQQIQQPQHSQYAQLSQYQAAPQQQPVQNVPKFVYQAKSPRDISNVAASNGPVTQYTDQIANDFYGNFNNFNNLNNLNNFGAQETSLVPPATLGMNPTTSTLPFQMKLPAQDYEQQQQETPRGVDEKPFYSEASNTFDFGQLVSPLAGLNGINGINGIPTTLGGNVTPVGSISQFTFGASATGAATDGVKVGNDANNVFNSNYASNTMFDSNSGSDGMNGMSGMNLGVPAMPGVSDMSGMSGVSGSFGLFGNGDGAVGDFAGLEDNKSSLTMPSLSISSDSASLGSGSVGAPTVGSTGNGAHSVVSSGTANYAFGSDMNEVNDTSDGMDAMPPAKRRKLNNGNFVGMTENDANLEMSSSNVGNMGNIGNMLNLANIGSMASMGSMSSMGMNVGNEMNLESSFDSPRSQFAPNWSNNFDFTFANQ